MELSELERTFVERIRSQGSFSCRSDDADVGHLGSSIRADIVRAVILGLPVSGNESGSPPARRVLIEGITIVGDLDLSDTYTGGSESAVALLFNSCRLSRVNLRNARCGRLSLRDCEIIELDGRGAHFSGEVDLSGLSSSEDEDATSGCHGCSEQPNDIAGRRCTVNLNRAVINGVLNASRARLCAPPLDEAADTSAGDRPYALMLAGANVRGAIVLQPDFVAVGGVNLSASNIAGSIWLQGATLIAEWDSALSLQGTHVEQSVALSGLFRRDRAPSAFEAEGTISLYGAIVDGELYMEGARIRALNSGVAVDASMATIKKLVRLSVLQDPHQQHSSIPPEIVGQVRFLAATLGGFEARGAIFDGHGACALEFTDAQVNGDVNLASSTGQELAQPATAFEQPTPEIGRPERPALRKMIHRCLCRGSIQAIDANITGRLALWGAKIEPTGRDAVLARGIRVGNRVQIGSLSAEHQIDVNAPSEDKMVFSSLRDGAVDFSFSHLKGGIYLSPKTLGSGPTSLSLLGATIDGEVHLSNTFAKGLVDLESAVITKDVLVSHTIIRSDNSLSLDLHQAAIGGTLSVSYVTLNRELRGTSIKLGGSLNLLLVSVTHPLVSVNCSGAQIGGDLNLACETHGDLSLDRAYVAGNATIQAFKASGWDGSAPELSLQGSLIRGKLHIDKSAFEICAPLTATETKLLRAMPAPRAPGWHFVEGFCVTDQAAGITGWLWDGSDLCLSLSGKMALLIETLKRTGSSSADIVALGPVLQAWQPKDRQTTWFEAPLHVQKAGGSRATFDALRALDRGRVWPIGVREGDGWRELDDDPAQSALAVAALHLKSGYTVRRVRTRALSFYPSWTLVEGLVDTPGGQAVLRWLWDGSDETRVLDGTSIPMHAFNSDLPPRLRSDEDVKDYVRFFCGNLWTDHGGFSVIDDADDLPFDEKEREDRAGCILPLHVVSRDVAYKLVGTVAFGGALFTADFRLHPSGLVEMLNDAPVDIEEAAVRIRWEKPFVVPVPELQSPPPSSLPPYEWPSEPLAEGEWNDMSEEDSARFRTALNLAGSLTRISVWLAAAHARVLVDDFGRNWGDHTLLHLGGFTYDQIDRVEPNLLRETGSVATGSQEEDAARLRLRWLKKQDREWPPRTGLQFDSQPHSQLASAYRSVGRTDEARRINFDRLVITGMHKRVHFADTLRRWHVLLISGATTLAVALLSIWFSDVRGTALLLACVWLGLATTPTILDWAFRHGFGYGLFPERAILTFGMCLLAGGIGVQIANRGNIGPISFDRFPQVMEVDVTSVNDTLRRVPEADRRTITSGVTSERTQGIEPMNAIVPTSIPCGDQIDPFLYATDVFIPILDLKQEAQCAPSGSPYAIYWQWAKALYAVLGWIITSLTILTVSGVLRTRSGQ